MSSGGLYTYELSMPVVCEQPGNTSHEYPHSQPPPHQHCQQCHIPDQDQDPFQTYSPTTYGEEDFAPSATAPWTQPQGSPVETSISRLRLDGEGGADHPSPYVQGLASNPVHPIAAEWLTYTENEFTQNFNGFSQYGRSYFLNNNTNTRYQPLLQPDEPLFPPDDISTTGICQPIKEDKENLTSEIPPDQNQNKSVNTEYIAPPPVTSVLRFKCPTRGCNSIFKRRAELDRHTLVVHQPSPSVRFPCPILGCNRSTEDHGFTRKDNLRQHLKLKHDMKFEKGKRCRVALPGQQN